MNSDHGTTVKPSSSVRTPRVAPASTPRLRAGAALLTTVLGVAYPLTTHMAVARRSAALTVAAIVILAALVMIPWLASGRLAAWLSLPVVAAGCWLISDAHLALLPLYLPPVIIPASVAWLFGRTLLSGQTPLIEQFVRAMERDENPPAEVLRYARQLTSVWAALLSSLALINLLLATFATPNGLLIALGVTPAVTLPQEAWSLFANLLAYLIILAFFIIEYAIRRQRFPEQPYRNFLDFIRRTIAVSPRLLNRHR
jgi:uncharacterized membrane protein